VAYLSQNSKPKNRVYRQPKTGFSVLKNSGLPGFSVSAKTGLETRVNDREGLGEFGEEFEPDSVNKLNPFIVCL